MVDLNKKPLPNPHAKLIEVLGKIAEKRAREEIVRAIEADYKLLQCSYVNKKHKLNRPKEERLYHPTKSRME